MIAAKGEGRFSWFLRKRAFQICIRDSICTQYGIPFHGVPFGELSQRQKEVILYGAPQGEKISLDYVNQAGYRRSYETVYELSLIHI